MSHPYRMQLPGNNIIGPGKEEIDLKFPDAIKNNQNHVAKNSNNIGAKAIKPHQILAKQQLASNTRKSHPYLQQLPTGLSKSMESLHLNSPKNQSFDNLIGRSPRGSQTSDSTINHTSRSSTLHSSKPINGIRSLLADDGGSSYYPSDKSMSDNDESSNSLQINKGLNNNNSNVIIPNSLYRRDEPLRPKNEYPIIPEYTPQNELMYKQKMPFSVIPEPTVKAENKPIGKLDGKLDSKLDPEFKDLNSNSNKDISLEGNNLKSKNLEGNILEGELKDKSHIKVDDNLKEKLDITNVPQPKLKSKDSNQEVDQYSNFTDVNVDSSVDFSDISNNQDNLNSKTNGDANNSEINQELQTDQDENFTVHKKTKSVLNLLHPVYNNSENPIETDNKTETNGGHDNTIKSTEQSDNKINSSQIPNNSNVNLLPLGTSIDMYRQNAKKTKDPETIFTFAQILIRTALSKRSDNPLTAKDREEYLNEAFIALKKASKLGSIEAQYYLGDAYSVGLFNNGKPDLNKSLTCFESAAKAKHAESAYRTAMCYKKGWGCTRDARKAVKYLEIASLNNHPVAMMEYGIYAFHGLMSFPDDMNTKKKGISWLRRATECATELSCGAPYELALIYLNGFKDIVIKDTNYAIKLLFKASSLGHGKSASMLGKFYEIGDIVEQNADLSIHFYNMSANLGDVDGIMGLCSWYFVGSEHLPQDFDEAFAWAYRAAENYKHIKAMLLLKRFYELGVGCDKDLKKSKYWGDLAKSLEKKQEKKKQNIFTK